MRIITISREFGSGGRELGKRLSEALHIPCYDKEIIDMIAKEQGLDEGYIGRLSEKNIQAAYSLTIGRRFSVTPNYAAKQAVKVAVEQYKMIERLAAQGDCVLIGRCADIILKEYHPFKIFVYADKEAKLRRCMERFSASEQLSPTEIEKIMRQIDRNRVKQREVFMDSRWGVKENYHLCINTSEVEIKSLIPFLESYVTMWFSERDAK